MRKLNYVALGIGICFVIAAAFSTYDALKFLNSSVIAEGIVVGTPFGPHHREITFATQRGEQIRFSGSGFITQHVGDQVRVRYVPDDPRPSAQVDKFGSIWDGPVTYWGMTFLWILAALRNVPFNGWGRKQ